MNNIFRKSALERLSSPEQLDKTIVVTAPMSWLAIIGVAIIIIAFIIWAITGTLPTTMTVNGIIVNGYDSMTIRSANAGELTESVLTAGKTISRGEYIGKLKEQNDEEFDIKSTQNGIVTTVCAEPGDMVDKYDIIAKISPDANNGNVVMVFLPIDAGKNIQAGMSAIVAPVSVDTQKYGHMEAEVVGVDDYVISKDEVAAIVGNNSSLTEYISPDMPLTAIALSLKADETTVSGYYWTAEKGKQLDINDGMLMDVRLIIDESAPISKLLPIFNTEAK